MKKKRFKNGNEIPSLGFGTWQIEREITQKTVEAALEIGYRHIDTAEGYGNLDLIQRAIEASNIKRSELFLTTKVWVEDFKSKEKIIEAGKRFLDILKTEYQDLILIHWPLMEDFNVSLILEALQELKECGLTRNIGVSNFSIKHMKDALSTGVEIVNNQIELHPSLYPEKLTEFCERNGIAVTGYTPLAWGKDLKIPLIENLAEQYRVSPAQICIAWQINKGYIVIPRSRNISHIADNLKACDLVLDDHHIAQIDKIKANFRILNKEFLEREVPQHKLDWRFELED